MKKLFIKAVAVVFAIIGSHSLKAQIACPFTVNNHLGCDLLLSIQFYDGKIATCPPCGPPLTITVPGNTIGFTVPCTCVPACDVSVQVIRIAGPCTMPYTSGTGSPSSPMVPLPGLPTCCNASPGAHFVVHPAGVDFHP